MSQPEKKVHPGPFSIERELTPGAWETIAKGIPGVAAAMILGQDPDRRVRNALGEIVPRNSVNLPVKRQL